MAKYTIVMPRSEFSKKPAKKRIKSLLKAGGGVRVIFTR